MNRNELLRSLEVVKPGLANKDMIEQATCFAFIDGYVVTYNDEMSIRHPIDCNISGAVKAEELYALLGKLKAEEIELTATASEIQITAGRVKAGMTLYEEVTLPLDEIELNDQWESVPDDFIEALSFCLFSCSKDMSRPVLTCVHISEDVVESCDNHRLTRFVMENPITIPAILIPASSAAHIIKYPLTEMALGRGWIHFKTTEGSVISARVFEDEYVDLTPIIDRAREGRSLKLPTATSETLERAGVFAKKDFQIDQFVTITFANKRMKVRAQNDVGWVEEELNILYTDDPVEFAIHPKVLQDILKKTTDFTIGDNAIKFAKDNWLHVAALLAAHSKNESTEPAEEEKKTKNKRKKPSDSIPKKVRTAVTKAAKQPIEDDVPF